MHGWMVLASSLHDQYPEGWISELQLTCGAAVGPRFAQAGIPISRRRSVLLLAYALVHTYPKAQILQAEKEAASWHAGLRSSWAEGWLSEIRALFFIDATLYLRNLRAYDTATQDRKLNTTFPGWTTL